MSGLVIRVVAIALLASCLPAQLPLLHYAFDQEGTAAWTTNVGTVSPGQSPIFGHTVAAPSPNGTHCLTGSGNANGQVTTPLNVNFGNAGWTVGFFIDNSANPGGFQYVMGENIVSGWRIFTSGASGVGNIRMTGTTAGSMVPTADIAGGAGDAGWVHVAWIHHTLLNLIYVYLDGVHVGTVLNANPSLTSGAALVIGRNVSGPLLPNAHVEDFRVYGAALSSADVAAWAAGGLVGTPDFTKVLLTEASPATPHCVEITNFDAAPVSLTNWRVKWRTDAGISTSAPIDVTIGALESIVVSDDVVPDVLPPGTQALVKFASPFVVGNEAFTVALVDPIGTVVDEVRVRGPAPLNETPSVLGGAFRGTALWNVLWYPAGTSTSFERIWGLDSDGGTDWTEQPLRSLGRENRSSSTDRGDDWHVPATITINEIDDSPDYVELYNPGGVAENVGGAFLIMHASQGSPAVTAQIPVGTLIPAYGYLVLGDTATAPAELPSGVTYLNVGAIPFTTNEFSCALYDARGRVLDVVRAPVQTGTVVHNHPRAPSYWSDFVGSAGRNANGGDDSLGRDQYGTDTDSGADFRPMFVRSMGGFNANASFAGPAGHDDVYDVRLNETGAGQALDVIMNAGWQRAGYRFNFLVSSGHSNGLGPFFGLGADALVNLPSFFNVAPFSGLLDSRGSGRITLETGSLPPGVNADFLFVLQDPAGAVVAHTLVLEFDT